MPLKSITFDAPLANKGLTSDLFSNLGYLSQKDRRAFISFTFQKFQKIAGIRAKLLIISVLKANVTSFRLFGSYCLECALAKALKFKG